MRHLSANAFESSGVSPVTLTILQRLAFVSALAKSVAMPPVPTTPQLSLSFILVLLGCELVNHVVRVRLPGLQDHLVLPGRHVDRVRELLRLEAQPRVLHVRDALAA